MLAGCYEWVPDYACPACRRLPTSVPMRGGPPLRYVPLADTARRAGASALRGHVWADRASGSAPLAAARVRLQTPTGAAHEVSTDSAGEFTFVGVPPGRYRLRAARVGVPATWDSVDVPWAPEVAVEVALSPVRNDGPCSGFSAVRVRRPWWKF